MGKKTWKRKDGPTAQEVREYRRENIIYTRKTDEFVIEEEHDEEEDEEQEKR